MYAGHEACSDSYRDVHCVKVATCAKRVSRGLSPEGGGGGMGPPCPPPLDPPLGLVTISLQDLARVGEGEGDVGSLGNSWLS